MATITELSKELIHLANSNSFGGTRGNTSNNDYLIYAEKINGWNISEAKKQKLLDTLHKKWTQLLSQEAQHVSMMYAGPANYNAKKLDHSDRIFALSKEITDWFSDLEEQTKNNGLGKDKSEQIIKMIEFTKQDDNPCDPTSHLVELAFQDNKKFIEYFEELLPKYKWRKNSNIYKLYEKSLNGEIKEIKKEVFFEDENLTAYIEGDRAYIKFMLRPQRQMIVALKSRGWWWNSGKTAWSTYLDRLDKEWVSGISERYSKFI